MITKKEKDPYNRIQDGGRVRVRLNKDTILLVKKDVYDRFESEEAYIEDYLMQYTKGLYSKNNR